MKTADDVIKELERLGDPKIAASLQKYFKTGPGEYGEGDIFIGLKVPTYRSVAKRARALPPTEIKKLIASPLHEARSVGLELLVELSLDDDDPKNVEKWADFYWKQRRGINNWDLVDLSAPVVMGRWLVNEFEKSPAKAKAWIKKVTSSKNLWERRIAVLATYALIKKENYDLTLLSSRLLLDDEEDLIHKATGWMLREAGKRSEKPLDLFLKKHAHKMPRTMLRYSIEKKPKAERDFWMRQKEDFLNSRRAK